MEKENTWYLFQTLPCWFHFGYSQYYQYSRNINYKWLVHVYKFWGCEIAYSVEVFNAKFFIYMHV